MSLKKKYTRLSLAESDEFSELRNDPNSDKSLYLKLYIEKWSDEIETIDPATLQKNSGKEESSSSKFIFPDIPGRRESSLEKFVDILRQDIPHISFARKKDRRVALSGSIVLGIRHQLANLAFELKLESTSDLAKNAKV